MIQQSDVEFIIVGSGNRDEDMRRLIKDNGMQEKVILFPMVGHDKLPDIYGSFDVFCFPTTIKAESLGLVGIEAMSCEIPCIISLVPGPSSYCNKENSIRYEAGDAHQLRDAMIELINANEEKLEVMKKNARKTALEYDSLITEEKFLEFFDAIIN